MVNPYSPPPAASDQKRLLPPSRGWLIPICATALSIGPAYWSGAWDTVTILIAILVVLCVAPWYTRVELPDESADQESVGTDADGNQVL